MHADEAFVQHRIAGDIGLAAAQDRAHKGCSVAGASPLFSTESVIVNMYLSSTEITRLKTRPSPLSQVSVTGCVGVRALRVGGPDGCPALGVLAPARARQSRSPPNRRPARRGGEKQADVRALRVDRLVVVLEDDVVDLAALEVDRAAEARRVDGDAGIGGERLRNRLGRGRAGAEAPPGATAVPADPEPLRRLVPIERPGFAPRLRLVLALIHRAGVKILPRRHHQHRQRDGEKQVSRILVRSLSPVSALSRSGRRPAIGFVAADRRAKSFAQIVNQVRERAR